MCVEVKSMGERALKLEPFSMFPRPYGKGRQLLSKKIKKGRQLLSVTSSF